jgi:putative IMPACT (imprinted ancient) family translation regulator
MMAGGASEPDRGGAKLGKGGLARAYAGAVREAAAELPAVRRVPAVEHRRDRTP